MTTERRYNDKEVALILQRAAEMSQAKTAGGMSVEELERIALEAGLDPAAVRQAADEVGRGEASAGGIGHTLLGGPTALRVEMAGQARAVRRAAVAALVWTYAAAIFPFSSVRPSPFQVGSKIRRS